MSVTERTVLSSQKKTGTLSHEIFELLLQLRILVVDAPHDGMLEGTADEAQANSIPAARSKGHLSAAMLPGENRERSSLLFLMDLVLPERDGAAADLQYRPWVQARQHGLAKRKPKKKRDETEYGRGTAARPIERAYMRTVL